jgi:hypothetical protein
MLRKPLVPDEVQAVVKDQAWSRGKHLTYLAGRPSIPGKPEDAITQIWEKAAPASMVIKVSTRFIGSSGP